MSTTYYVDEEGHHCQAARVVFTFELCRRCQWWGIWVRLLPRDDYEPFQNCRCELEML